MHAPSRRRLAVPALLLASLALPGPASAQRKVPEVPYVPSPTRVVERMLEVAEVGPGDVVYDLGSGDGRIVITAALRHGARGVGIDLDEKLVRLATGNAREAGVADRVRFVHGDLFEADLRPATVVTLFLLPGVNLKLRPLLLEQLRPGTRVVSNAFSMGEWEPDSVVTVGMEGGSASGPPVYYWVIPARAAGLWSVTTADGTGYEVEIEQEFQAIRGTARTGGRVVPLEDAELVGDRIAFSIREGADGGARGRRFVGRVESGAMRGTLGEDGPASSGSWSARRLAPSPPR